MRRYRHSAVAHDRTESWLREVAELHRQWKGGACSKHRESSVQPAHAAVKRGHVQQLSSAQTSRFVRASRVNTYVPESLKTHPSAPQTRLSSRHTSLPAKSSPSAFDGLHSHASRMYVQYFLLDVKQWQIGRKASLMKTMSRYAHFLRCEPSTCIDTLHSDLSTGSVDQTDNLCQKRAIMSALSSHPYPQHLNRRRGSKLSTSSQTQLRRHY